MLLNKLFVLMQKLMPKNFLSHIVGKIANIQCPLIKNYFIQFAIKKFDIDLKDSVSTDPNYYCSFNDFFTRKLKNTSRYINYSTDVIISPVDGNITQYGIVKNDTIIQAKNKPFTVQSLLVSDIDIFTEFIIFYLAPKNYHRVHIPLDGKLIQMTYIPGTLFSVNSISVDNINQLFARNERVVCYFKTLIGTISIVFVGALFVSSIVTSWQNNIALNCMTRKIYTWSYYKDNIFFKKGEEIGYFNFGSTVICLFSKNKINFHDINVGNNLKMGNTIATIK